MQRSARPSACSSSSRVNSRSVISRWSMPRGPRAAMHAPRVPPRQVYRARARVDGSVEDVLVLGALHHSLLAVRAEEVIFTLSPVPGPSLLRRGERRRERRKSGSGQRGHGGSASRPATRAAANPARLVSLSAFALETGDARLLRSMEVRANLSRRRRRGERRGRSRGGRERPRGRRRRTRRRRRRRTWGATARLSVILSRRIRAGEISEEMDARDWSRSASHRKSV